MTYFWEEKSLAQMSRAEWESLCDGCAKCCLHKFEDETSTGPGAEIYYTDVACHLLDLDTCRCGDYPQRVSQVAECLYLTPAALKNAHWLPTSCAYRLLSEGKPLAPWHPLLSGVAESVHRAGISVRGRAVSEDYIHPDDVETRIVHWV